MIRRDQAYWQRLRKNRRSNWAAGCAGVATIAATVSLIGSLVQRSQYEARATPLYWLLMLPVVWWLSGLGRFEPRHVRLWKPALAVSVAISTATLIVALRRGTGWGPDAAGFAITIASAAASLMLLHGSLVAREGPAR